MSKRLLYSEPVCESSSDEAESGNLPGSTSWLRKFQSEDKDSALEKAIEASKDSKGNSTFFRHHVHLVDSNRI